MKATRFIAFLMLAAIAPRLALADLAGPYTPDADTLFLLHFDEAAGGSVAANVGTKGGVFYSVNCSPASTTPPTVTEMLGAAGYVNGAINFNTCMTNPTIGDLFGYDFNNSGAYEGDVNNANQSADRLAMTNLNIGNGGQTPFTLEALIQPEGITSGTPQEIICTDSSVSGNPNRGLQFRVVSGTLNFQFVGGPSPRAVAATIPTSPSDPNAFVAGNWYHVAAVYDGANVTLYWTKLDPANGAANQIGSGAMALGTAEGAVQGPLVIGCDNRAVATERFVGSIDEVRISGVARAANGMQFFSPAVTIAVNPVSQNVDYNQPVTFEVAASSLTALSYQWRFNSNSITGGTNSTYVMPNVVAASAGYYDVVITNTAGYAATSSPALLVVGAANFLSHRYSFTTDASDSVGTAHGTLLGTANVTGGQLVMDGTYGTYMELPGDLFNAGNATALTVEFWATFGANANNARVFNFGNTNAIGLGVGHVGFSPHNSADSHQLVISPSGPEFDQSVTNVGVLDGLTRHIACVIDPPNKILAMYTNGVLEAVNTNMTVTIGNLNDALSFVGRSLTATHPYLNASIDELRLFKGALSDLSIKQSDDLGPDNLLADGPVKFITQPASLTVPVGWTVSFSAAAAGYLPISYQWFKNGGIITDATNSSYSLSAALGDNNATFVCYATNTIGVTTYVTNSTTATLNVFTPPTLAWVDAGNGGSGDGQWNTSSLNWKNTGGGGVIAFAQTNGVVFDSQGSGSPTVDLAGTITPYKITANAATDYTLTSYALTGSLTGPGSLIKQNSGTFTIDITNQMSGPVTITGGKLQIGYYSSYGSLGTGVVTNNATLSFNRYDANVGNPIHGTGTVSYDGYGTTTVSGNSDYTGNTLINAGIVNLTSSTGLGSASTGTTVANGGQLALPENMVLAESLTLDGFGDGSGALRKSGAGVATINGAILLAGDTAIGVDGGTLNLSNVVSGSAALTATGAGTLALNANNPFGGGFNLSGPIVRVNDANALGTGPVTVVGNGRFIIGSGLTLAKAIIADAAAPGTGQGLIMVDDNTNGTVTTVSGPLTFNVTSTSGGNFVGPTSSGYLHVTGPVTNTVTGVVVARAGHVRFSGGGNYTVFTLGAGATSLGANNGLSHNAALTVGVSAAGTFDLNGFNQSLTGLAGDSANAKLLTNSAATLNTLTLNLAASNTYNGVVAGPLALVVNGTGSLLLSGTNAYTGNTTVNGGTLEIAQPTLAAGSTVSVANGAFLQLDFAGTNTVAGLVLGGMTQTNGVFNATTSAPFITGTGSLRVQTVNTTPTNLIPSRSGDTLTLGWPADHTGWRLQVQTNTLGTGLGTNWVEVPNTATTNSYSTTLNATNGTVFYRMVYP